MFRRALLLLLVGLALVLAACEPPPTQCSGGVFPPAPGEPMLRSVPVVGVPLTVLVQLATTRFLDPCAGGVKGMIASGTQTLEVFDPLNQPVNARFNPGEYGGLFEVHFTPELSGNYHVSLQSSPGGLSGQIEVAVAIDRSESSALKSAGGSCPQVGRTSTDAFLCGDELKRDGETLLRILSGEHRIVGHSFWAISGDEVRRWVERDGAMIASPAEPLTVQRAQFLSATEDEALVLTSAVPSVLLRYRATDAGWELRGSTVLPEDSQGARMVHRMGDVAFTLTGRRREDPNFSNLDILDLTACSYALGETGEVTRTTSLCQPLTGLLLAATTETLWTLDAPLVSTLDFPAEPTLLRMHRREGNLLNPVRSLLVPSTVEVGAPGDFRLETTGLHAPATGPTMRESWVLARELAGEIVLERYPETHEFLFAQPGTLWLNRDGHTDYVTLTP